MDNSTLPQSHGGFRSPCNPGYPFEEWDRYFLGICLAVAKKSKDPRCKVGAVIVSTDNLVVATGFNGLARGMFDDEELLQNVDEKLTWICHAEFNAILNAARTGAPLKGSCCLSNNFSFFRRINFLLTCCRSICSVG